MQTQQLTKPTRTKEIKRAWHLVDAKDQILGRVAVDIAHKLMGKNKTYFARNQDCGDFVVVINARHAKLSGKKETEKVYTRYSGYPSGLHKETVQELRERKPTDLIKHAVAGMLPKNRLRERMQARLYVFADDKHTFEKELSTTK